MEADLIAGVAAEEIPDRCVEAFAFDVPQCNVDGADCAGQRGAAEGSHSVHVLPVMLDARRIFADEVVATLLGDSIGGFHVCPARRLSDAVGTVFGPNSYDVVSAWRSVGTADEHGFDFCNFGSVGHFCFGASP